MSADVDPRILKTRSVVLSAAVELLAEFGFERITVDRISERSGVARSTIYRHWPEPKDLLVEAFEIALPPVKMPDTGDIRADLVKYCVALANLLNRPIQGAIVGSLIHSAERDPKFAQAHARYTAARRARVRELLENAVSRGALPNDIEYDHVITTLVAPIFYCRFIIEKKVYRPFIEKVVDGVLLQISATRLASGNE